MTDGATLRVETTLRNTGKTAIRTPYYSHNLLNVDDASPTGPAVRLALDVNLSAFSNCPPWAEPLEDYFARTSEPHSVLPPLKEVLRGRRAVVAPTRVKAVYRGSAGSSNGSYLMAFDREGLTMRSDLTGPAPLYAYNLYIEERTLSPEPIQMVAIEPGEAATLTQTVHFRRNSHPREATPTSPAPCAWRAAQKHRGFVQMLHKL